MDRDGRGIHRIPTTTGFDAVPWRPLEEVERSVTFRFVFRREVYYRHWIVVLIEEKKENEMFLRVSFSLCTIIYRKIILNNSKISSLLRPAWQVSAKMTKNGGGCDNPTKKARSKQNKPTCFFP